MKTIFLIIVLQFYIFANDYNATATAEELGMYYQDYNFLMGLTGILIGFIFMFFTLYTVINISRG